MARKAKQRRKPSKTLRASVSFPKTVYQELERLAEKKKVSVAWVVRDAAEKYVEDQWPLVKTSR